MADLRPAGRAYSDPAGPPALHQPDPATNDGRPGWPGPVPDGRPAAPGGGKTEVPRIPSPARSRRTRDWQLREHHSCQPAARGRSSARHPGYRGRGRYFHRTRGLAFHRCPDSVAEGVEEPRLPAYSDQAMSRAFLASALRRNYLAVPLVTRAGSAISEESRVVRDAVGSVVESVERSEALFGRKAATIAPIWALANECAEPGWDSDGAEAVDRFAAFAAADFIRALPGGVPLPEVAPEPDGSISLDWIRSRNSLWPRSVMLYQLHTGWVEGYREGQEPLIHLVSTSQAVAGAGLAYFLQESGESLAPGPPGATPSCSSSERRRLERVCRLC